MLERVISIVLIAYAIFGANGRRLKRYETS